MWSKYYYLPLTILFEISGILQSTVVWAGREIKCDNRYTADLKLYFHKSWGYGRLSANPFKELLSWKKHWISLN